MEASKKPVGNAQTRLLAVIEALSGREVFGVRLKEVAATIGAVESTALRDLQTLEQAGWAKQDEGGKWRLGARPIQICHAFFSGLERARRQVEETELNYTRTTK